MASERVAKDAELESSINNVSNTLGDVSEDLEERLNSVESDVYRIPGIYATQDNLNNTETELNQLIEGKADASHTHSEYLTSTDISEFITLSEVPVYAPISHGHSASEISGLDDLFMTPPPSMSSISMCIVSANPPSITAPINSGGSAIHWFVRLLYWSTPRLTGFGFTSCKLSRVLSAICFLTCASLLPISVSIFCISYIVTYLYK